MNRIVLRSSLILLALSFCVSTGIGQPKASPTVSSFEVSDDDGVPVIIKHLPDWEKVRESTVLISDSGAMKAALPGKPVLDQIEIIGGAEAVTASYPAGRMLIVEFSTPQASSDADARVLEHFAASPDASTIYRRIGNYNVFVFDAADPEPAIALVEGVKYEKTVQWLGEDPFLIKKIERYFVETTRDIFISTVIWIVSGLGLAIVSGLIVGFFFYRFREHQRATRTAYSDAGGLTRLNLDGLSE